MERGDEAKEQRKKGKRTCSEDGAWLRRWPVDAFVRVFGWRIIHGWSTRVLLDGGGVFARPLAVRERAILGAWVRRRARWPMEEGAAKSVIAVKGERLDGGWMGSAGTEARRRAAANMTSPERAAPSARK
jgi:hypothetical protein